MLVANVRLQHPMCFVVGSDDFALPETAETFAATRSCVIVPCRVGADAPTKITLASDSELPSMPDFCFEAMLTTHQRRVRILDSSMTEILETEVSTAESRIRIALENLIEPDEVLVVVG